MGNTPLSIRRLYLVRHGDAVSDAVDPARPLSDQGRQDVRKLGQTLAHQHISIKAIFHSGKLRAQQTAELLAATLHPAGGMQEKRGLMPLDAVAPAAQWVSGLEADTMIVGHLPFLEKLAALLVLGDEIEDLIHLPTAGAACLHYEDNQWRLCAPMDYSGGITP